MAFSAGTTRSAGYVVLTTDYNLAINNVNYLGSGTPGTGRPAVMATSVLDTSLAAATWTNMLFASEEYDTGAMHSTVTNTGRLTVVDSGLYQVTASVFLDKYNTAAGKMCGLMLRKNAAASPTGGTLITESVTMLSSNNLFISAVELNTHVRLSAADYLELFVMQDSGSALVLKGSSVAHRFGALWLSA
tara:strand:- start:178 stop:744 length:567 start_codon:yes stop_codon:yes gene_type:complete